MNCNQCGTEVPAGSAFCTKCGARLAAQNVPPPPPPPPAGYAAMPNPANELPPAPPPYAPVPPPVYTGAKHTSGMAIASLVLGIASFLFNWLIFIPSLLGLIFGILALVQIGKNPALGGKTMAIIGIILSVVAGLIWLAFWAAIAALIPWSSEVFTG